MPPCFYYLLIPHLLLVNRQTDMIISDGVNKPDIILNKKAFPFFSSHTALPQPVGYIHSLLNFKIVFCSWFILFYMILMKIATGVTTYNYSMMFFFVLLVRYEFNRE